MIATATRTARLAGSMATRSSARCDGSTALPSGPASPNPPSLATCSPNFTRRRLPSLLRTMKAADWKKRSGRRHWPKLLIAEYRVRVWRAKSTTAFNTASVKDLQARLKPLVRKTQPYAKRIAHRGIWVEPSLLAEIEYRAKSEAGKVRHPFFKGIREDL